MFKAEPIRQVTKLGQNSDFFGFDKTYSFFAPENRPGPKRKLCLPTIHFRLLCLFQGGYDMYDVYWCSPVHTFQKTKKVFVEKCMTRFSFENLYRSSKKGADVMDVMGPRYTHHPCRVQSPLGRCCLNLDGSLLVYTWKCI